MLNFFNEAMVEYIVEEMEKDLNIENSYYHIEMVNSSKVIQYDGEY